MGEFLKEAVTYLRDILVPIANKLGDPDSRKEFQHSIGYKPGTDTAPSFPAGSAMQRYIDNEEEGKESLLFAQSMEEVAQIIEGLRSMYQTGAATYYSINPGDADRIEQIQLAISELITLTINIFTLDYFRLRYPTLHAWFIISGIVDEMGQRAGGSGFLGKVIASDAVDFCRGLVLKDETTTNNFIQSMGLAMSALKFIFLGHKELYLSGGFETYTNSHFPHADNASKSLLSFAWFIEKDDRTKANLYATIGLIPRSRSGGGFYAKLNVPADFTKKFSDLFSIELKTTGNLEFFFANDFDFDADAGKANKASVFFKFTPKAKTISILKSPELTVGYGAHHAVELRFNSEEIGIIANTEVSIKFGKGKATSFPFGFIPASQYEETLPLSFGWTTKKGLFFNNAGTVGTPETPGSPSPAPQPAGALRARAAAGAQQGGQAAKPNLFFFNLPIKTSLAGLTFRNIHIGFGKDGDHTIVETSLDFTFVIGKVFVLAVTRLGGRIHLVPRDDDKGFFGNDLDVKFKPPTGIGISVDVSVVKGGGFLSLDDEKGEYIGALELALDLSIFKFNLKAFGIIQTKIPGAPKEEYSLFIVISSDFKPIPLVFGLTLNGVGGLIGHNRTADISLIQSEMRSPYLENILFLKDPIANISRLVTDSSRYFPIEIDKSIFGFSLILGYAEVLELRLAVIFIPADKRILIPGFLRLATPKKSTVLKLQVNFLAVIDRKEGYFFFRADLVESTLVTFKLTGSLVFAIGWGNTDGLFAISIGGFHPSYKNFPEIKALPNAFKGLDRLRISLWEEGKNHLYLEMYMAITSNSRQLGAHAYLHVNGPSGFNIDGHLGFDILWETEPKCYFEAGIEARIDFRHNQSVLAGVSLNALFTGPTPKHIEGKAKLKICWFLTVTIPFSKTWGDPAPAIEEEKVDLDALITEQLSDDRNWRAEIPAFHQLHVTLRPATGNGTEEIIVQPLGAIIFAQRAVPLNHNIQRVGSKKATVPKKLSIQSISSNGTNFTDLPPTNELFAPGQFVDLNEDEKLARPSFERMDGGVKIGDTGVSNFPVPFIKAKQPEYELTYIVPDVPAPKKKDSQILKADAFQRFSRNAAASRNVNSWQSGIGLRTAPKKIDLQQPSFVIAGTGDMKAFTSGSQGSYVAKSQSEAEQTKKQLLTENPGLQGQLQVLANYELTT